jgi:hypothetical protein
LTGAPDAEAEQEEEYIDMELMDEITRDSRMATPARTLLR